MVNHQILLSTLLVKGISGTALQWFDSYLSNRSFKASWRGEALGATGHSSWTTSLFCLHGITRFWHSETWLFISLIYADDTQLYLSFHPDDLTIAARISACLADISCWMKDHQLQLNLVKTELLVVPANPSFHYNFTIQLYTSTITPSKIAIHLGVMLDDQLTFSDHIAKMSQSCRFALFNIKKMRPFLSEHASQLLVLSRLGCCSALLAGLPASSIIPLQLIQNVVAI